MAQRTLTPSEEIRRLYPGRSVVVSDKLTVTVRPVGLIHIEKFTGGIVRALAEIMNRLPANALERPGVGAPDDAKTKVSGDGMKIILPVLTEVIITDLLGLVRQCCSPDISEIPHWHLADIVSEWIDESFGEERKLRPWVRAIERLLEKLTGEKTDLWATLSNSLSPEVIRARTSSITSNLGSRTQDGASLSSGTGTDSQNATAPETEPTGSQTLPSRSEEPATPA